jgi:hypothetical protein
MRFTLSLSLLILFALAPATTARATSYIARGLEELLDTGGPVVVGKIIRVQKQPIPRAKDGGAKDGGERTLCTVEVGTVLRGDVKPGATMQFPVAESNSPRHLTFAVGDEGVWLLYGPSAENEYSVGMQSRQPIAKRAEIERALALRWVRVSIEAAAGSGANDRTVTIALTNEGTLPISLDDPANHGALMFYICDEQGNTVLPVMRGKGEARPDRVLTLKPGHRATFPVGLPRYTSSTGIFGFELFPVQSYRITAVYRPDGTRSRGIGSNEEVLPGRSGFPAETLSPVERDQSLRSLRTFADTLREAVGGKWQLEAEGATGVRPLRAGGGRGGGSHGGLPGGWRRRQAPGPL